MLLRLEELERRDCPSSVCNANPTYQAECAYVNNLIPQAAITITAVQSGSWSDPATWGGRTPTAGDNVCVPTGVVVTVNGQEASPLRSILDNGLIAFAPNANTSLLVNTLVVTESGELDIGTAANPIQAGVTASLIFADSASVSPGLTQAQLFSADTQFLSGGLIDMGTLNINGSQVTPYVNLAGSSARAGSTSLTLTNAPVGWRSGDTLLLPGTLFGANQDEQIRIAAIQNNADGTATITLASPLQYSHVAPMGQNLQVANESRSVVIEDQNTPTQYADAAYGHVMEMHNDAASIFYAAFLDHGRTDKSVPLGSTLSNGTVNTNGRYGLHFHRDYYPGINDTDPPIPVVGCFQANGVGWGYVNHSSNVNFIDDVAYNDFGACFADQAGNEIGMFQDNLAIGSSGLVNDYDNIEQRSSVNDFGFNGLGYWLQSANTQLVSNFAYDVQDGFVYLTRGLNQGALGVTTAWDGKKPEFEPLATFSNNVVAGADVGLIMMWRTPGVQQTIDGFTGWNIAKQGIQLSIGASYTSNVALNNVTLLGLAGAKNGIYCDPGYSNNVNIDGSDVEGFAVGMEALCQSSGVVNNSFWDDAQAIYFPRPSYPTLSLDFTGSIGFGASVQTEYYFAPVDVAKYVLNRNNGSIVKYPNDVFLPAQILLPNGQELYSPCQAANYVPFPSSESAGLPASVIDLTNAQLYAQFGFSAFGLVAPSTAQAATSTNGLIGPAQALPVYATLDVPASQTSGTPITIQYGVNSNGAVTEVTDPTPEVLQLGWNLVSRNYNGQEFSWFMYGR